MSFLDGDEDGHSSGSRLSVGEQATLAQAPKRRGGFDWRTLTIDVWNAPNEVIGKTYGYLGDAAGQLAHAYAPSRFPMPEIRHSPGRTEFLNNPFATGGAVTIGDNTVYEDDPYSPAGRLSWKETERNDGHPIWEHEQQHVTQARELGPLYLPSNILGLTADALFDRGARIPGHGAGNWNEVGPQMNPPRPWR